MSSSPAVTSLNHPPFFRSGPLEQDTATRMLRPIIAVLDGLPDPVLLTDDALQIVGMNGAAILRYGSNSLNRPLFGVIRQPQALHCIERAQNEGETRDVVITEIIHDSESKLRLAVTPLMLAEIPFDGLLLSLTDITSIRDAEQARKDFVANVSHELKSPLTTLMGFIETIDSDPDLDTETRHGFLRIMKDEAAHMSRLVSELLTLSKVEAQEYIQPTGTVHLCRLITSLANGLTYAGGGCPARIVTQCTEEISVNGDVDQLRQVLSNLLDNALKYSPSDSPVEIRCTRSGEGRAEERAIIEVVDHGPGIDPIHLPRLTERFYRIDPHRTRDQGGAGLGLAIAKHIINRHRGRLEISSEPGRGSTFSVHLPLRSESHPENAVL